LDILLAIRGYRLPEVPAGVLNHDPKTLSQEPKSDDFHIFKPSRAALPPYPDLQHF